MHLVGAINVFRASEGHAVTILCSAFGDVQVVIAVALIHFGALWDPGIGPRKDILGLPYQFFLLVIVLLHQCATVAIDAIWSQLTSLEMSVQEVFLAVVIVKERGIIARGGHENRLCPRAVDAFGVSQVIGRFMTVKPGSCSG